VAFSYVHDDDQIVDIKIPIDSVEIGLTAGRIIDAQTFRLVKREILALQRQHKGQYV